MGSGHHTRPFCHSSTVEGRRCYILRAIFLRGSPRLSWRFIGVSLPHATVVRGEVGAWRLVLSHYIASPYPQPPGWFVLGHLRRCAMRTGVQNENISAPCGLPFMSRVTEVRGCQKTFSISSRVERTTIPLSETSSSVPACL